MKNNTQSRKYLITINNPSSHGFTRDKILEELNKLSLDYFCLSDEIAGTGTEHTHVFIYSHAPIRFSTVKRRFSIAHIDKAYGTVLENKEYIAKTGKWEETDKRDTSIEDSFYEWGDIPTEGKEKAPIMAQLIDDIRAGFTTAEIVKNNPKFAFKIKDIEVLRETILSEKYMRESRKEIEVYYYFGDTETGKTREIFTNHNPLDVCRITSYKKSNVQFDAYHGQPVLVFEDFHSQVNISTMLNYLDIYPIMLPARYNDRVACYHTVYILTNIPLEKQYIEIQNSEPATWDAFKRRITTITEFTIAGKNEIYRKGIKNEI